MTSALRSSGCLDHDAFVYASEDEFAECLTPLLVHALGRGRPAVAVVPKANAQLLADTLGDDAARVSFVEADGWYRHPAETIGAYDRMLRTFPEDAEPFVIGEVQFGETPRDWLAWTRYESALNRSLQDHRAHVVCPYDKRTLPASVVDAALRTHPHLLAAGERSESSVYAEPEVLLPVLTFAWDAPQRPPEVDLVVKGNTDSVRRAFRRAALAAGFEPDRVEELTLALNEIVTNALVHGGGQAHLRTWVSPEGVTCVVDDEGPGVDDALLGYRPPAPDAVRGYGMWLARRIFDDLDARRTAGGGLSVVLDARNNRPLPPH